MTALLVLPGPAAAMFSQTWTTDSDWNSGIPDGNFVVVGTGVDSYLELRKGDLPDWMLMAPSTVPPKRDSYCLAWIARDNSYFMFGGYGSGGLKNDTWKYNFTNDRWTQIFPPVSPSARSYSGCAYDPVREVVVLFGGLDSSYVWRTDTWWYYASNDTWQQVYPTGGNMRQLEFAPLTYDSTAKRILTLARNPTMNRLETWAYDPAVNSWTNRNPSASPTMRDLYAFAYGSNGDRTVLFSGGSNLTILCDTWEYAYGSNTWQKVRDCTPNVDPYNRVNYAMSYRDTLGAIIMYGGKDETGGYAPETWAYIIPSDVWLQLTVTASPGQREGHRMVYSATDDANLVFGGYRSGTGLLNDTWELAKGYIMTEAVWTSPDQPINAGCTNTAYDKIWFNQTHLTKPTGTILRFQIATSTSPTGPWTFRGPDGYPGAHYTTAGQDLWSGLDGQQYFRIKAKLKTTNGRVTPRLQDVTITWDCPPTPPYVRNTNPAHGAQNHPPTSPIWVNFSEPMDTPTVQWTISGGITATGSWSNGDTTLLLTPTTPFLDCTNYTARITQGKDVNDGLDLVAGPVPNPWTFRTRCVNPFIVTTDPADKAASVPVDKSIVVTFSEPMTTGTVQWTIIPTIGLSGGWNPGETVLTLTHATAFTECAKYTVTITQGEDKQSLDLVAGPVPNPWSFTVFCPNPMIVLTNPADGAAGVPVTANVVVTFSEGMNIGSVTWTSSPGMSFSSSWNSPTDTVLTLSHSTPFLECRRYTLQITAGRDKNDDLPLVPGPVPNPWNFTTECVNPYITNADPANGMTGIPIISSIVVTFSEAMDAMSATWTINPTATLSPSWNSPTDTVLTLSHSTPFEVCTLYTVRIVTARDKAGLDLVAGPVPNPWSFTTYCPLTAPGGLTVTRSGLTGVLLDWRDVPGATSYHVYESQSRFAAFPSGWTLIGSPPSSQFVASHYADGLTHFYVVRAYDGVGESANSTMGVKAALSFALSSTNTNVAWFSLPFVSAYRRASDIANELTAANVDVIGKWIPSEQRAVVYYFARGRWRGTDFTIGAGDGLYVGVKQSFNWAILGTDSDATLSFTVNPTPKTNVNWISLPYTGTYTKASDLSAELTSSKIVEVGKWDASTQTSIRWYWTTTIWTGTDFAINPGDGIYIVVVSGFSWGPRLVTPYVP